MDLFFFVCKLINPEEIHVAIYMDVDEKDSLEFDEGPVSRFIHTAIEKEIDKEVKLYKGFNVEDDIADRVLLYSHQNDIDLLIVSSTNDFNGSDLKNKIYKNVACSVFLLPFHIVKQSIETIFVPVDFSDFSREALNLAASYNEMNKLKIVLSHVYHVPSGYHATGKSYAEVAENIRQSAKRKLQDLIKEFDPLLYSFEFNLVLDDDRDPSEKIYLEAQNFNSDLIIMGAKGVTKSSEALTGNFSYSLCLVNETIPQLVLKNKKENLDLAKMMLRNHL